MCCRFVALAFAMVIGMSAAIAHAELESRLGGEAVYDSDLQITWLADANLAASNDFGVRFIEPDGWTDAISARNFVAAMNLENYLGFSDWRLPSTLQPDPSCGTQNGIGSLDFNCTGGEMGHLFYNELGGLANQDIADTHDAGFSLFRNVQSRGLSYWSGTESGSQGSGSTWSFEFGSGRQRSGRNLNGSFMWPVRPGDVAVVPEPEVWLGSLACLSLLGLRLARRTRGSARPGATRHQEIFPG